MVAQSKIHVSWHIAMLCFGFLLGVAIVPFVPITLPLFPFAATALIVCFVVFWRRSAWLLVVVCLAGILLGFLRGSSVHTHTREAAKYVGQTVVVEGTIVDDPTLAPSDGQRVTLRDIQINGHAIGGVIWAETNAHAKIKRSDTVRLQGVLHERFGTFSGSMFRAQLVSAERTKHGDVGLELRDWFAGAVRAHLPALEADLGLGYLLGQRSDLPESMNEKLQLLGLTHVVVASGYNLTILVRFARRLLVRHSKYLATASAAGMIVGFVLITGFSPSMSRAALVTGLALAAWYVGRRIHPLVLLPFAAAITLCFNPSYVWGDIGWYLSFTSFAGVLLLAPIVRAYFYGSHEPPMLVGIFIETMSAQMVTFPLTAFIFGQYALLALPANMLILPFVPLAMACTFIAGLVQIIVPFAAPFIALPAKMVLRYMTFVIDWLGAIPGSGGVIAFGPGLLIASYICIVLLVVWLARATKFTFKNEDPLL
jgi:competence protein ComEC